MVSENPFDDVYLAVLTLKTDIAARFCTTINQGQQAVSCCLPCPTSYWIFDDSFQSRVDLASYISIISLVCNVFLLLTFLVLPQEKSHRHYLSVGLTSSFILVALSFVIPLGTQPELCYNDITPHNERTQASCAATGVFVELGALGVVVWGTTTPLPSPFHPSLTPTAILVLLRSIWTALRITINIKHVNLFQNLSIALGIGLPILFMAISLPITSVSYSLGNVCVPSNPNAFQTWFVWILVFTGVSEVIQVATIGYCIWRFTSFSLTGRPDTSTGHSTSASVSDAEDATAGGTKQLTPRKQKHVAWKRARGILKLQWRSMVLAFIVVNLIVYFGMFFVQQSGTSRMQYLTGSPRLPMDSDDFRWMACLMANGGDKKKCLHGATGLGVKQQRVEATLILAPVSFAS